MPLIQPRTTPVDHGKTRRTSKGSDAVQTPVEVVAADPVVNGKQPPLRLSEARPADLAFYAGKDLSVTQSEKDALVGGDVLSFWTSRVGKDPVARVGMSIWANREQLTAAIEKTGVEHWTPEVGLLAAIGLQFKGYPKGLSTHPTQKGELIAYWSWMGEVTRERVLQKAADRGQLDHDNPEALSIGPTGRIDREQGKVLLEHVGLALARAHSAELHDDQHNAKGDIPGLLSLNQIALYHHAVFKSFGLPKNTYGGTPVMLGSFTKHFQLAVAGGLYAPDSDPNG